MNRNSSLLAGMLVAVALFGVSSQPNKTSESPSGDGTRKSKSASARIAPHIAHDSDKSILYSPCTEIAKRLQRFVSGATIPVESWLLPDSCYESGAAKLPAKSVRVRSEVHFAIATVPDPVSTHLSLLFDRIVESTQQAAQDNNYSYDSSWFPWNPTEKDYPLLADQQAAGVLQAIEETQPGVMLFRRALHASNDPYGGGLVIFVVGEQPTGGIRDEQFENALAWIGRLGGLDGTRGLRILGPTFSGSLPSLQRALAPYLDSDKEGHFCVYVSSGTVSSPLGPQWFGDWIQRKRPGSRFRTAMESDSLTVNRFCQYLRDQHYDVSHVALLSEDDTAFGRGTPDPKITPELPCDGAIDLYYPRDIATLRSAYEQQAVLNPKSLSSGSAPSTTLRGDLSEPTSGSHDAVRRYGGQVTPLAQEAILLDIVNRLAERQVQFVVVRSTSSLDQIFLSEFLRRSYSQGRVVIDGADLLFNRGTEGRSLRGVMMLTPYPLLTAEQDWTSSLLRSRTGGYRTFAEDTAEAVYIAARELLRDPQLKSEIPIHDYAPPAWAFDPGDDRAENQRPATWIGVIGRRQFWPVAVLNSLTMNDPKLSGTLPSSFDRGDGPRISKGETTTVRFPIAMWMFLLVCCGWSWCHAYFCWKGSIMGSPRALAYFAPTDRPQHAALIAFGSVLIAMLAVTVATASGLFSVLLRTMPPQDHPAHVWLAGVVLLLTFMGALTAYAGACRVPPLCASGLPIKNTKRWREIVAGVAILVLVAYWAEQLSLLFGLTRANLIPTIWRSVNLLDGVSPLLPELLLLIGVYLWFWCGLRGLAHFGDDRPQLPRLADLPRSEDNHSRLPMFSWEVAGLSVEHAALPLTGWYAVRLLAIFAISITVSAIALRGIWIRTLGERAFGSLIFFWICLAVSAILTDGIQTWRAWTELRHLLIYLDRLPLRRTLRSLKGLTWGSIWKMSGNVLEERYRMISLQSESLRHLNNTLMDWAPDNERDRANRSAVMSKISECHTKLRDFAAWYVSLTQHRQVTGLKRMYVLQEELASTAAAALTGILLPAWEKETVSLIFSRSNGNEKAGEDGKAGVEIQTDGLCPQVRAAEEFFVLPYLAFIQNILGRFRTIALGSLWLFIGATVAVSSYPFDPLNVLGAIFLTVFVSVGGVMIVVYSQMSRDATLSHITNTKPGELGIDFWVRLLGFGVGPLLGLLTTLFPSITDFALSWLQPSVAALK